MPLKDIHVLIEWRIDSQLQTMVIVNEKPVGLNHVSRYTCLDQEQQDIQSDMVCCGLGSLTKGTFRASNDVPPSQVHRSW